MHVDAQGSRLVNHVQTGTELGDQHTAATSMAVAGISTHFHERTGIVSASERGTDYFPILGQVPEEFQTEVDPVIDLNYNLAGQDWIFLENGERYIAVA